MSREIQFLDTVMMSYDVMNEFVRKADDFTIKTGNFKSFLEKKNDLYKEIFSHLLEMANQYALKCSGGFALQTDDNINTLEITKGEDMPVLHVAAVANKMLVHAASVAIVSDNRILDIGIYEIIAKDQDIRRRIQEAFTGRLERLADKVIQSEENSKEEDGCERE